MIINDITRRRYLAVYFVSINMSEPWNRRTGSFFFFCGRRRKWVRLNKSYGPCRNCRWLTWPTQSDDPRSTLLVRPAIITIINNKLIVSQLVITTEDRPLYLFQSKEVNRNQKYAKTDRPCFLPTPTSQTFVILLLIIRITI